MLRRSSRPGLLAIAAVLLGAGQAHAQDSGRFSLDSDWRFHLGDIATPVIKGHLQSYYTTKAGVALGAAAPSYDDSGWRELNLPHDWAVEGPFDANENTAQGYRPRGIGWYRRRFQVPAADRGHNLELQFDGIATNSTIWLNGTIIRHSWSGYTASNIDVSPLIVYGPGVNTIAVRVDANAMEGWWYEGAGIYRHTWLAIRAASHFVKDGVYANPVRLPSGRWTIPVEATVANSGIADDQLGVVATLRDAAGKTLATGTTQLAVRFLDKGVAHLDIPVAAPHLWSVDDPALYTLQVLLTRGGKVLDTRKIHCGFRTLRWDANLGFFLNDKPLKIKGTCNHQDHAGLGVAVPDSLWEFRLRRLKAMGSNAYRCAHNPPAAEFLDACDRLGMLVVDENRTFNFTPDYLNQLEWMVRRDRNHPSVFLWSLFDEEPAQSSEVGREMARTMRAAVRRLDNTRAVTAGMSGGLFALSGVAEAVDVVGFNYFQGSYGKFHRQYPRTPFLSLEDTSAFMTRGEYRDDDKAQICNSYDTRAGTWGATHRESWRAIATRPFVAGSFVWSGFDYRGESTPFDWPAVSSSFGILDTCGFPKTAFSIRQAQWIADRPILQLAPHWNWTGHEGQPVHVMAMTNADEVSLSLNGQSLGTKKVDRYAMVSWDVPYAPGNLEAIGRQVGREVARCTVATTGPPTALQLIPDRQELAGNGTDALPVTVRAVDAAGRPVPTANLPVAFALAGPGRIIGLGNGDSRSHEPEKGSSRALFNGLAQVILQSNAASHGPLTLTAQSNGLTTAQATLTINAVTARPSLPGAASQPIAVRPTPGSTPVYSHHSARGSVRKFAWVFLGGLALAAVSWLFSVLAVMLRPRR